MPKVATQQFLEFDQIREGFLILRNKALRGILMISSLNFALKPSDEKDAIVYLFQEFLNSLDFPLQIYVQSRKLNITSYLDKLKELEKNQKNELLQAQITGYHDFIETTIKKGTIMSKGFYVVVPFTILEIEGQTDKKRFGFKKSALGTLTEEKFQRCKTQLWQRMEFVALGLKRCGLNAVPLTSPELVELFWGLHHPREAEIGYYPEIPPELLQQ